MSFQRIRHIVKKELIHFNRDPIMKSLILILPIIQLMVFGYAITADVTHISTAVLDMDETQPSRELIDRFTASRRYFDLKYRLSSPDEIDILLDSGRARMAIWIPRGFAADIAAERPAQVQVLIDGVDSRTASTVANYVSAITGSYSEDISMQVLCRRGMSTVPLPGVEMKTRAWYNPELKSVNFLVPGVLAVILFIVTMVFTSLAVVKERETGTLEQINVTPIKPIELMIGKVVPFVIIGYVNVLTILAVAVFLFGVPLRGSILLLLGLTAIFLTASLGAGLLVSTISKTQQQAVMVSFFVMQPSILLSGLMFPIDNMPRFIQYLTYGIPLRYYIEIVRGIFMRGVGLEVLWPQAAALLALGTLMITASALAFNKRID